MKVYLTIEISNCEECPFNHYEYENGSYCNIIDEYLSSNISSVYSVEWDTEKGIYPECPFYTKTPKDIQNDYVSQTFITEGSIE